MITFSWLWSCEVSKSGSILLSNVIIFLFVCVCVFHYLAPCSFCPLIYYSPKEQQIEVLAGRLSEWPETEMLSFPHYALVPGVWHVLYIFLVPTSLNKYDLMYSSQEMKFYATDLFAPNLRCSAPPHLPSLFSSFFLSSSLPKWADSVWFLITILFGHC